MNPGLFADYKNSVRANLSLLLINWLKTTKPWFFIIITNLLQYFSSRRLPLIRHKRRSHSGPKILHFDTSLQPSVTTTRDFDHSSLWHVISTMRHNDKKSSLFWVFFLGVTDCRNDGWAESRVEVTDFGAWDGVALVSKWRVPATGGLLNSNSWLKFFKQSQT